MKPIYFDQNITKELCNNSEFSNSFFKKKFNPLHKLIITPLSLIELSGTKITDCLKEDNVYELNVSDSISNQMVKGHKHYENNVRGDIISFLEKSLKKQKQYVKMEYGNCIFNEYLEYLDSTKGIGEIPRCIIFDRISSLPLERFKRPEVHFEIDKMALNCLYGGFGSSVIRLLYKSLKKRPIPKSEQEKKIITDIKLIIEKSDFKQKGDLVDAEMIYLSLVGCSNLPMNLYTKDNAQKIKYRIIFIHMLLNVLIEWSKNLSKDDLKMQKVTSQKPLVKMLSEFKFIFGNIFIVNDSGCIQEKFSVKDYIEGVKKNNSNTWDDLLSSNI